MKNAFGLAVLCAMAALYAGPASAAVVYVKLDAAGSANGSSWANAYTTIQAAVTAASSGDEIWVAQGVYTGTASPIVAMKAGVALYGGFAGTETVRTSRAPKLNHTCIDGAGAYRCLEGASDVTLDGFIIQHGFVLNNWYTYYGIGSGMYNNSCSNVAIANCTFSSNKTLGESMAAGAGMYNADSSVTLTHCLFKDNYAGTTGAYGGVVEGSAIYHYGSSSSIVITGCRFDSNCSSDHYLGSSSGLYTNSFGAVYTGGSTAYISNSVFYSNKCLAFGATGTVSADGCALCAFSNTNKITNCTFAENVGMVYGATTRGRGGALYCDGNTTVSNSIFWNDRINGSSNEIVLNGGTLTVSYSCVQGGYSSGTNILTSNPLFIADDDSLYLSAASPCIDAGTNTASSVPATAVDILGTPRPQGSGFDLGAHEYAVTPEAAFSASATNGAAPLSLVFSDASTPGTSSITAWSWEFGDGATSDSQNPAHEYTAAGTYDVTLTVTTTAGSDTETKSNYVTVGRSTATVSEWPTASGITYGQSLSASSLSGGVHSVDGSFAFANPTTIPQTGTYSASIVFIPADTNTYNPVYGTASVSVAILDSEVTTWPTASSIMYGNDVSAATLSGGISVTPGTFHFVDETIAPDVGRFTASVMFTPADAANYTTLYNTASITVAEATPEISQWPTATAISYGDALSASTLSGGSASPAGVFAFDREDFKPSAGTYSAAVTFEPSDPVNYATVSSTVDVTVSQQTPAITIAPTATAIAFGQTLASSYLLGGTATAGTTAIAGTFAFANSSALPDSAGTYPAPITFTPADTENYLSVTGTVNVAVTTADCPDCIETTGPYTTGETACIVVPGTFPASTTFTWSREDGVPLDTARCTGINCQRLQIANLKLSDAATYVCTYDDGSTAKNGLHTVTIAVSDAASVPAQPHGPGLAAVVILAGLVAARRYRRHLVQIR